MDATSYLLGKKSSGGGPTPTGTINITENGTSDVTNYASANVNVQPDLETKSVTITENTTTTITPTTGKDGLSSVEVTTNVSGGGSIETLDDVNDTLESFYNYLDDIPNSYESLSSDNITLYTPNADFKKYIILKDGTTYKMYWTNYNIVDITGSNYARRISLYPNANGYLIYSNSTHQFYQYSKKSSPTLNELLEEIKNSNASTSDYTYKTNVTTIAVGDVYATNLTIVEATSGDHKSEYKLSSNETIEVIS